MTYNIAILGATGAVGREMISILEEREFPVNELRLLASQKSAGTTLAFKGKELTVEAVSDQSFDGIHLALFSAGGSTSKKWAPVAVEAGAVVVDNSSAWRMDDNVPLVVPEVNPDDAFQHKGIIANPNCSTIQMVVALKPIYEMFGIKRIVVSTYQAVSGSGNKAIVEMKNQLAALESNKSIDCKVYPHQIANNCLPHIDEFVDHDYTREEMKMVNETHKILGDDSIAINATTVRVPVYRGHSESIYVETRKDVTAKEIQTILTDAPGVSVIDDPVNNQYPTALNCEKRDPVFIGRIRQDLFSSKAFSMWVVSDNLRKGAALNAIQIGELLFK